MARADNAYSRFVTWLKVLLPVLALALLSTLFLFSDRRQAGTGIPFSDSEIEELARHERLDGPGYSGVTRDGARLQISAKALMPGASSPETLVITGASGRIDTPDGQSTEIEAATATIDTEAGQARLSGGVRVRMSSGYSVAATGLFADLDRTRLESIGDVSADGPPGHLTAGQMVLTERPDTPGSYVLVFKVDVKLVYLPPKP